MSSKDDDIILIDDEDVEMPETPTVVKDAGGDELSDGASTDRSSTVAAPSASVRACDLDPEFKARLDNLSKAFQNAWQDDCIKVDLVDDDDPKVVKCSISNCESRGPLISPLPLLRRYYQLPKGYEICMDCAAVYEMFSEDLIQRLKTNETISGCCFGPNSNIVVIDDDADDVDTNNKSTWGRCAEKLKKPLAYDVKFIRDAINPVKIHDDLGVAMEKEYETLSEEIKAAHDLAKQDDKELYELIQKLYQETAPITVKMDDLDIPPDEEDDDCVVTGSINEDPTDLPPFGNLERPKPKHGGLYYIKKGNMYSEWVPGVIIDFLHKPNEKGEMTEYVKARIDQGGQTLVREVELKSVAYIDPPSVRLYVGTRVIAYFNNNSVYPKKFYSGVTAELPTRVNKYRYLIFLENGYVQYVEPKEVRVICDDKKDIEEFFPGPSQHFIRNYFRTYPDVPLLKVQQGAVLKADQRGAWTNVRVTKIDVSLIQVYFLNDYRVEWLFRGSPRLQPIYEKLRYGRKRERPFSVRSTSVRNNNLDRQIEYTILSDDDETSPSNGLVQSSRAVARKSTGGRREQFMMQPSMLIRELSPPRRRTRMSIEGKVERVMPKYMASSRMAEWHRCMKTCVAWLNYNERKIKGINPLSIPSIFAFKRQLDANQSVAYISPCGKILRRPKDVLNYLRDIRFDPKRPHSNEISLPLTVDLFDFSPLTRIFDEFIVPREFVIMDDVSSGCEKMPIPCVNTIDGSSPELMKYLTERKPLEGVNMNLDSDFLVCCSCTDDCQDKANCECFQLTYECYKSHYRNSDVDINKLGYKYMRLEEQVVTGIYECNSRCGCSPKTCVNRVAQHPIKIKLQLFKTKKKGWGTRCLNDVPHGTFICVYVGNILTEEAANRVGKVHGDVYFAELDHIEALEDGKEDYEENVVEPDEDVEDDVDAETNFVEIDEYVTSSGRLTRSTRARLQQSQQRPTSQDDDSVTIDDDEEDYREPISFGPSTEIKNDPNQSALRKFYGKPDDDMYVMDAKIAGNIGRYLNHSCDPNIYVQNVFVDTHDLRFPWIAFFAGKHIQAGSELTWNYGYAVDSVPGKQMYCYCGSANCRKRLL